MHDARHGASAEQGPEHRALRMVLGRGLPQEVKFLFILGVTRIFNTEDISQPLPKHRKLATESAR